MDANLQKIKDAAAGLLFMSESDYPLEIVHYPDKKTTPDIFLKELPGFSASKIEKTDVDHFFRNMVKIYPDMDEQQNDLVKRFENLKKILKENLSGLVVIRIGEVEIDAYIIGKLPTGEWGGLKTKIVET